MSLIFGIFNRNGKKVLLNQIEELYKPISNYPHEKYDIKVFENVGFGHMLTYNTPESLYETQPILKNDSKELFVFKGRLDNRKELSNKINLKISDTTPDGDIALEIVKKFKEESFNIMLGDWALAYFNYEKQELLISRDHHGYTAIHYYYDNEKIIFSSSIKSILNVIKSKINEEMILRILGIWSNEKFSSFTLYKDIYILEPSKYIKINKNYFKEYLYWNLRDIKVNNSKKIEDYTSELYYLLETAIKNRLRSYKPVASMLSGGLDSGSVAYIASQLFKKENKTLSTYSHVPFYEVSKKNIGIREGDEKPFIKATVEASGNIKPIYLQSENIGVIETLLKYVNNFNICIHAGVNAHWIYDIKQNVANDGFGVLLTGEHGNGTISFAGLEYSLSFNKMKEIFGLKFAIKKAILRPFLLNNFPNMYRRFRKERDINFESYSYINPLLFNDIKARMKEEKHDSDFIMTFKSHQELILGIIIKGSNPRCYMGGISGDFFGIELRDPTADKNIIEYILSIPNEAFYSKKYKEKNILKNMMKNKLPDKVLFNTKKGLQGADIGLRVAKEKDIIFEEIEKISNNDIVNKLIDTKKLKNYFYKEMSIDNNEYNTLTLNNILRTIMVGEFIYHNS
ncbi:MAG: asparagine synthase-related protein [Candidatus Sericytochromatia bacterium]